MKKNESSFQIDIITVNSICQFQLLLFISTDEYVDDDDDEEEEEEYDNLQDLESKDALNQRIDLLSNTHGGLPLLILVLNLDV